MLTNATALIDLVGLVFNLIVLAVVLGVVGWGVSKLLHARANSRRNERMNSEALIAAAKSRADQRRAARA